ncbi:MAG: lmo0937 family membrane protein [Brumimicrobium sp.]
MGNILYIVAVVLLVIWAVGFFAFSLGAIIHIVLVIAVISFLIKIITGRKK